MVHSKVMVCDAYGVRLFDVHPHIFTRNPEPETKLALPRVAALFAVFVD